MRGNIGQLMKQAQAMQDNMRRVQEQLATTEERIAYARGYYNAAVADYERARRTFPSGVVAAAFGFAVVLDDRSPHGGAIVADTIFRDRWTALAQVVVAGCGFVAVLISYGERMRKDNVAEYYALLSAAGNGAGEFTPTSTPG